MGRGCKPEYNHHCHYCFKYPFHYLPPFFKQNRKAEHTVVSSSGSSALLPCVSSLRSWKAWLYRDLNVALDMYSEHFSYQVFTVIISPQIHIVFIEHYNFVPPQKWKHFTQKSQITSLITRSTEFHGHCPCASSVD